MQLEEIARARVVADQRRHLRRGHLRLGEERIGVELYRHAVDDAPEHAPGLALAPVRARHCICGCRVELVVNVLTVIAQAVLVVRDQRGLVCRLVPPLDDAHWAAPRHPTRPAHLARLTHLTPLTHRLPALSLALRCRSSAS